MTESVMDVAYRLTVCGASGGMTAFAVEDFEQLSQARARAKDFFRLGYVTNVLTDGSDEDLHPIAWAEIRRVIPAADGGKS